VVGCRCWHAFSVLRVAEAVLLRFWSLGLTGNLGRMATPQQLRISVKPWPTIAATLTVLAAPAFFVFDDLLSGGLLLLLGLAAAWHADRGGCDVNAPPAGWHGA